MDQQLCTLQFRLLQNLQPEQCAFLERLSDKEIAVGVFAPEDGQHALAYGEWFRASEFDAFKSAQLLQR